MIKFNICILIMLVFSFLTHAQEKKPNVLFIAVDDLRPDLLACYGNSAVKSPNIDRLASEGLMFQRTYAQLPLCMPSRASVLSGYRPESINNTGKVSGHVPANTVTLPKLFRDNGYITVSIGKVYHANNDDPESWVRRYTDTFTSEGEWSDGYCSDYRLPENIATVQNYLQGKRKQGLPASSIIEITDKQDETTPDGITAGHAIEELRKFKQYGEPFFLAAGFYRPHMPLTAPKIYWDMYNRDSIKLPANFSKNAGGPREDWDEVRRYGDIPQNGAMPEEKAKDIIHGYLASVTFVDAQIGKVLDELRALGLDKNTVVVLWSDNGWRLGEHGQWSKPAGSECPTRVTMMLKAPGISGQGSTSALTELIDIYPTLAELCKLKSPTYVEGTSLVPLLLNPKRPWKTAAFSNYKNYDQDWHAIRTDHYRMIEHANGNVELYDYRTDPYEDHNLAKDPKHAKTVKQLKAALKAGWRAAIPTDSR